VTLKTAIHSHSLLCTKHRKCVDIVGAITEKNQAETLRSLIDQAIAADAG